MKPEPLSEQELFHAALELPPAERAAWLDRACAGNDALRAHLKALLAVQSSADALFDPTGQETCAGGTSPSGTGTVRLTAPTEKPGDYIGPYKIREQVGEGGCGIVYVAEQEQPIRRRVALKVIKDTKAVIARFEAERQALAMMDHPNIARVLDAGATDAGRPYFVMELVRGIRITDYCDQANLSTQQRLDLFIKVCHAIQHAHQKGIIHRDIKPSNILVTLHDGVPVPKVIDFGIAKATEGRLTDATVYTELHQFIGTPAYMSPEQAEMSGLDIDTRSDIYSLGVLLYELLTGKTPFDAKELMSQGLDIMRKTIREQEPARPSTRLRTLAGEDLTTTAKRRSVAVGDLQHQLQGDLDWIVMKALEKDRSRRYDTANGFAADITRHLGNEPVLARPPSVVYLLTKVMRRHKLAFAALGMILLTLVAGILVSSWYAVQAARAEKAAAEQREKAFEERDRALKAEKQARSERDKAAKAEAVANVERVKAVAEKNRADEEMAIAKAVSDFLQHDILSQAAPDTQAEEGITVDPNLTVRAAVDRAAGRIENRFANRPLVEASIRMTLAQTYNSLGESAAQKVHAERAYKLREQVLGPEHELTLMAMNSLVGGLREIGAVTEAVSLGEKALELCRRRLGPAHAGTLNVMNHLAMAYQAAGKSDQALPLYEETLRLNKETFGPEHAATLNSMHNLAFAYMGGGRFDLAVPLMEETVSLRKAKLGPDHRRTLNSMAQLARAYRGSGRLDLALPLLEESFKSSKEKLGPEHSRTLSVMSGLASACRAAGKMDQSLGLLEEMLKIRRSKFGPDHPETLEVINQLAATYRMAGKLNLAMPLMEESLKLHRAKLGSEHSDTLITMSRLGLVYREARRYTDSEPLLLESEAGLNRVERSPSTREPLHNSLQQLVELYTNWGKPEKAAEWKQKLAAFEQAEAAKKPGTRQP